MFVFQELCDLILDFVDQLLALDLSGCACLLAFPATVACDCPQTVRKLLVHRIDNLFRSLLDPVLSAEWTEHGSATMSVFLRQRCLSFWLYMCVAQRIVLWATHGLPFRASVYRGCPCWDPPMCPGAQGGIKEERQLFLWLLGCGLDYVSCVHFQTSST